MSKTFVIYDKNGKYAGHVYNVDSPNKIREGFFCRELTVDEIKMVGTDFMHFLFNKETLIKLPEVYFGVGSPLVYEIGVHNKISIGVRKCGDTTQDQINELSGKEIEVAINGEKVYIEFGSQIFLNPATPGTYTIELTDERVVARTNRYTISVI